MQLTSKTTTYKKSLSQAMGEAITAERIHRGAARLRAGYTDESPVYANVGRNHPDYGLSPADHNAMKWARAQGWTVPQNHDDVTAHIKTLACPDELTVETGGAA